MINISLVSVGGEVLLNWLNKRFIPNVRSQGSIANTFRKELLAEAPQSYFLSTPHTYAGTLLFLGNFR